MFPRLQYQSLYRLQSVTVVIPITDDCHCIWTTSKVEFLSFCFATDWMILLSVFLNYWQPIRLAISIFGDQDASVAFYLLEIILTMIIRVIYSSCRHIFSRQKSCIYSMFFICGIGSHNKESRPISLHTIIITYKVKANQCNSYFNKQNLNLNKVINVEGKIIFKISN